MSRFEAATLATAVALISAIWGFYLGGAVERQEKAAILGPRPAYICWEIRYQHHKDGSVTRTGMQAVECPEGW